MAFSDEFRKDPQKQAQWQAFVRRSKPENVSGDLHLVIGHVAVFLTPVLEAARQDEHFPLFWPPGGPWNQTGNT